MQASNASSIRPAIPLNILAAFAPFAHLAPVADGRDLHKIASESTDVSVAGDERPVVAANKLLDVLKGINLSLTTAMAQPVLDQRVITLYKENSEHEHAIQKAALTAQLTLQALSSTHRPASLANHFRPSAFGLELPLVRSRISTFILSALEKWATEAGLEFFLDDQQASTTEPVPFPSTPGATTETMTLPKAKKVITSMAKEQLLIDIEFQSHPLAEDKRIDLVQNDAVVPISLQHINIHNGEKDNSSVPGDGNVGGTLQTLLEETISAFLVALGCNSGQSWRAVDVFKAERAAAKLKGLLAELKWIAEKVKQETEKDPKQGVEWSDSVLTMAEKAMGMLRKESEPVRAHYEPSRVPVDILALRTGGIPIPYMLSFSLSFLLYLSPLAYLTCLRHFNAAAKSMPEGDIMDIPFSSIRQILSDVETRERLDILVASISYEINTVPTPINEQATYPPEEASSNEDPAGYTFLTSVGSDAATGRWVLSFQLGEMGRPLIISQSRVKRIAAAVNLGPNSRDDGFGLIGLTGSSDVRGPSWLDLVMDPHSTQPARVYTSRYQPNLNTNKEGSDLINTLMALTEPGFALGKVPIRTLKEAYAVMVIVKEQIWLQSLLRGVGFRPGYDANDLSGGGVDDTERMMSTMALGDAQVMNAEEAKAMYDALMSGTYAAKRLRVTYEVLGDGQTGVRVTFPHSAAPVVTDVTLDVTLPKGVKVVVDGERVEALEEVVRRGGLLGLVISVQRFASNRV